MQDHLHIIEENLQESMCMKTTTQENPEAAGLQHNHLEEGMLNEIIIINGGKVILRLNANRIILISIIYLSQTLTSLARPTNNSSTVYLLIPISHQRLSQHRDHGHYQ